MVPVVWMYRDFGGFNEQWFGRTEDISFGRFIFNKYLELFLNINSLASIFQNSKKASPPPRQPYHLGAG